MVTRLGELKQPLLTSWVETVGKQVTAQSTRRHLTYHFRLLDTSEDNAFSLPGGSIMVTRGLLDYVSSDEELAGVLAHELAHSTNRDFARQIRQQAMYLGLQALLRHEGQGNLVMPSQLLQAWEYLRRSRAHEMQADLSGVELAARAGYDPDGLLSFLKTIGPPPSGLDGLLATHPPGSQRLQMTTQRLHEWQGRNYAASMALARSLEARWRLARASEWYRLIGGQWPAEVEPWLRLGQAEEQRGRIEEARAAYQQALQRDADLAEAGAATLRLTQPAPSPVAPPILEAARLRRVGETRQAITDREPALRSADGKLRDLLRAFAGDAQIARGLEVAQVISPETSEETFWAVLAQSYLLLARAEKTAMALGELRQRSWATHSEYVRLAESLQQAPSAPSPLEDRTRYLNQCAEQFISTAPSALEECARALDRGAEGCQVLTKGTRLVATAFLALVASGEDQPLGSLTYSRFLLLQGDIEVARRQLARAEAFTAEALQTAMGRHADACSLALSVGCLQASPPLQEVYAHLLAARLQVEPALVEPWLGEGLVGPRFRQEVWQRSTGNDWQRLQVCDTLLRISCLDMRAEQVKPLATPK